MPQRDDTLAVLRKDEEDYNGNLKSASTSQARNLDLTLINHDGPSASKILKGSCAGHACRAALLASWMHALRACITMDVH